jgi:hypothetical protein
MWKLFENKEEMAKWLESNKKYPILFKLMSVEEIETKKPEPKIEPKPKKVKRKYGKPLTEEEKNIITRLHFEGMGIREIAATVNRSYGGVYSFVKTLALRV